MTRQRRRRRRTCATVLALTPIAAWIVAAAVAWTSTLDVLLPVAAVTSLLGLAWANRAARTVDVLTERELARTVDRQEAHR